MDNVQNIKTIYVEPSQKI